MRYIIIWKVGNWKCGYKNDMCTLLPLRIHNRKDRARKIYELQHLQCLSYVCPEIMSIRRALTATSPPPVCGV
jgi:hypothetical protein